MVRDVWAANLQQELQMIRDLADKYLYIAMAVQHAHLYRTLSFRVLLLGQLGTSKRHLIIITRHCVAI